MMPWLLHCKIREEPIHQKGTSQSIAFKKDAGSFVYCFWNNVQRWMMVGRMANIVVMTFNTSLLSVDKVGAIRHRWTLHTMIGVGSITM